MLVKILLVIFVGKILHMIRACIGEDFYTSVFFAWLVGLMELRQEWTHHRRAVRTSPVCCIACEQVRLVNIDKFSLMYSCIKDNAAFMHATNKIVFTMVAAVKMLFLATAT